MCFEFGSCFGSGRREDYGGERAPRAARAHGRRADHRNGYYSGTDHKAPAPAYNLHHQPHAPAADDEAGHKAYHDDGAQNDHHADAGGGNGNGRYAAYVQDKAGYDTPKHPPAWHSKVGDDAGYAYAMRPREAADRRGSNAVDYHHYPTATTNTSTLVRY